MKIAVLGAGLCGLSTCWHLLHESAASVAIDLYDPLPIGEGTSGIASGLLHFLTSTKAKPTWQSEICLKKTHRLITAAATYAKDPPIVTKGVLQLAVNAKQAEDFKQSAKEVSECKWLEKEQLMRAIPYMTPSFGGLLIQRALTLDMPCYLTGLFQAVLRLGANFYQTQINDPEVFEKYDKVIIAMGAQTLSFSILKNLPVTLIKGQLLELKWPIELDPPSITILSDMHIVMKRDYKNFILGASFEREYLDEKKDEEKAKKILLEKLIALIPQLASAEVTRCETGLRVCPKNHLPLIGRIDDKFWFFTGLCSKGLLFHGFLGEMLAKAVLQDNPALLPKEILYSL